MTDSELHRLLRRLHDELGKAGSLDEESRELLGLVARDIDSLPAPETDAAAHAPALERLAVRFESGHPAVSATLRQLVDALAKAGI